MLADGQIGWGLALLGCLLAGSGVAIVAVSGHAPAPQAPDDEARAGRRDLGAPPGARASTGAGAGAGRRGARAGRRRARAGARSGSRPRSAGAGEGPAPLVEAAGRDLAAAGQPQGHALALGDVADLGQLRAGVSRRPRSAAFIRSRGQRDEQLVVLASGDRQLERGAVVSRRPPRPRRPRAPDRGRSRAGNRSALARCPASAPRPSLMSIIAVAPAAASATPLAQPWNRIELSREQPRSHASGECAGASHRPRSAPRRPAAPPSSPVTATRSRGLAPARVTKRRRRAHSRPRSPRRPEPESRPGRRRRSTPPPVSRPRPGRPRCRAGPDRRPARPGPPTTTYASPWDAPIAARSESAGGQRLPPDGQRAEVLEPEMDAVDDRVDGDRAGRPGLDHRGVVAARHPHPGTGRRQSLVDRGDQVELARGHGPRLGPARQRHPVSSQGSGLSPPLEGGAAGGAPARASASGVGAGAGFCPTPGA